MRALLVAPGRRFEQQHEILVALGWCSVEILDGEVAPRELLHVLEHHYDIVHYAGHAGYLGWGLSGEELHTQVLNVLGEKRTWLAVINGCKTLATAVELYAAGVQYTVGWQGDVEEQVALDWATTFYRSLRLSQQVNSAMDVSCSMLRRFHPGVEWPHLVDGRISALTLERSILLRRQRWLLILLAVVILISILIGGILIGQYRLTPSGADSKIRIRSIALESYLTLGFGCVPCLSLSFSPSLLKVIVLYSFESN